MGDKYQRYPEYKDSGVEWLGDVPEGWVILGLGKVLDFMSNGSSATQIDQSEKTVGVTRIETISDGSVNEDKIGYVQSSDISERFLLKKGDIQFSNINSLNMVGKCAIFDSDTLLYSGMNLLHIRPDAKHVDPKFMLFQFQSKRFRNKVEAYAKPAINQASIPTGSLRLFEFLCPTIEEQRQIAAFLDHETAKIDTLIEKQQTLIALLKEKRQAVISHAVTKGLNPDVTMRDSGVEWLGEVPEHWGLIRLKQVCSNIVDCLHSTPVYDEDGEYPAIRTADVAPGVLFFESSRRVSEEIYKERVGRLIPKYGDIFYSREGERYGIAALVPENVQACLAQRMMHFRVNERALPEFIMWSLNAESTYRQASQDVIGATSPHINVETIKNFWFCEPPLEEQKKIGELIIDKVGKYDQIVEKSEHTIMYLKERRTALISAAVTGKIDVRHWQAPA